MSKPVIPGTRANEDVMAAIDHYLAEGGRRAAIGFVRAMERAYVHVGRYPASGSARYAEPLGLPGLRVWRLDRYPYLVFYMEREDSIAVWRVLHEHRDIPGSFADHESE